MLPRHLFACSIAALFCADCGGGSSGGGDGATSRFDGPPNDLTRFASDGNSPFDADLAGEMDGANGGEIGAPEDASTSSDLTPLGCSIDAGCVAAPGTFYVATNGDDLANDGRSACKPFRTIQKCASIAVAGQTCLIAGGVYRETIRPAKSGSANQPITFAPLDCNPVTIDGSDPVSGWGNPQGKIFQASLALDPSRAQQVFLDGKMMIQARWPNLPALDPLDGSSEATCGQNTVTNPNPNGKTITNVIFDKSLNQAAGYWVGASIHIRGGLAWSSQTGTVTASATGQLTYSGANSNCPDLCAVGPNQFGTGSRYYLFGILAALDAPAEWHFDAAKKLLYLWTPNGDDPTLHSVTAKTRDNAFDLTGRSFIVVQNLRLFAATIATDNASSHDSFEAIQASYVSHFLDVTDPYSSGTATTGIMLVGANHTLRDSVIAYSAGNGVYINGQGHTVTNNLIHDTDYSGSYCALINVFSGQNDTITHNTLHDTGRDAIHIAGSAQPGNKGMNISFNEWSFPGRLNQDVGGLYTCCDGDFTGSSIDHNLAHDTASKDSRGFGTTYAAFSGAPLYLDNGTTHALVHHNVVWNGWGDGIHVNGDTGNKLPTHDNQIFNNTIAPTNAVDTDGIYQNGEFNNLFENNIFTADAKAMGTYSNNVMVGTDPKFVDAAKNDYRVLMGSPAVDAGKVIPGITDGFVGKAPDVGAYEVGELDWTAGCALPGC